MCFKILSGNIYPRLFQYHHSSHTLEMKRTLYAPHTRSHVFLTVTITDHHWYRALTSEPLFQTFRSYCMLQYDFLKKCSTTYALLQNVFYSSTEKVDIFWYVSLKKTQGDGFRIIIQLLNVNFEMEMNKLNLKRNHIKGYVSTWNFITFNVQMKYKERVYDYVSNIYDG